MAPTDKYIEKFFILTGNHLDFQAISRKSRIKIFLLFNEAVIACTSIIVGLASPRGHFSLLIANCIQTIALRIGSVCLRRINTPFCKQKIELNVFFF